MPASRLDRSRVRAPRSADVARRRAWIIGGAALLCLLVAGNARASIQGRHVVARIGHAVAKSHCLPSPPHADPFSSGMPLVAVLSGGRPSGYAALAPLRVMRAPGVLGRADGDAWASSDEDPRAVTTLPSHWGATHLSV
jgi:hypothetical protein